MKNFGSIAAPVTKLMRAVKERGWKGTVIQLYTIGDLKFGDLKGVDKFGNKYYEDLDQPFGQHRWVEYANIHDPDPTMIQPEWHGWMHHVFDEVPRENAPVADALPSVEHTDSIFATHVGMIGEQVQALPTTTGSQYRPRGYQVNSLYSTYDQGDMYYKQPGHPLSELADKGGRFSSLKNAGTWSPNEEQEEKK